MRRVSIVRFCNPHTFAFSCSGKTLVFADDNTPNSDIHELPGGLIYPDDLVAGNDGDNSVFSLSAVATSHCENCTLLDIDGFKIFIVSNSGLDSSAHEISGAEASCAIITADVFFSGKLRNIISLTGVSQLIVYDIGELSDADIAKGRDISKRVSKLAKKGIKTRIISSYPTDILL